MSISPTVLRRVMRELGELQNNPSEGIRVQVDENDMLNVTGIIEGPEGTPYAGGYFKVKFKFTEEFPAAPPKCWFATKIFHPNVGSGGEICVNTLKKDWKSTYGIGHILVTVKCLLIYPNPESALDEEAGKLLLEDYQSYYDRAKLITSVHATPRVKPVEFNTPSAQSSDSTIKDNSTPQTSKSEASTSKLAPPSTTATTTPLPASLPTSTAKPSTTGTGMAPLTLPMVSRKSPAPQTVVKALPSDKEGLAVGPQKERYPSPSPLGTADANVGNGKPGTGMGMGMASATGMSNVTGTKAVKRSATGSAITGAEKRKKALKRL